MNIETLTDDGKYYLHFWRKVLGLILGWSEAKVDSWAMLYIDGLRGESVSFYSGSPARYLVDELVLNRVSHNCSPEERERLRWKIMELLEGSGDDYYSQDRDWNEVKSEVDLLFQEYSL